MKIVTTTLAALLVSVGLTNAATLVFTNNAGNGASNAIVNSSGSAFQLAGATVSVGFFNTLTDGQLGTIADNSFLSDFNAWQGNSGGFTAAGPPVQNFRGVFTINAAAGTIAGSAFADKNMYIVVQNNSVEEYLILKSSLTFTAADDPTLPNVTKTFTSSNTAVLFGGVGNFQEGISNGDATPLPSWNTVAPVPEPSIALLGALGVLGLLRRRR